MRIGYARVSTREQEASLDSQRDALTAAECERVFEDVISGAKSKRPGLDAALDYMRGKDVLVVTRLDRLGRSTLDTIKTVDGLTERSIRVEILGLGIDSGTAEGRLMIRIMSALAEQELELIRERTRAGLEHARSNNRRGGTEARTRCQGPRCGLISPCWWNERESRGRLPRRKSIHDQATEKTQPRHPHRKNWLTAPLCNTCCYVSHTETPDQRTGQAHAHFFAPVFGVAQGSG